MSRNQIYYSDRYYDDYYEYRHVVLPREMAKCIPRSHLMSEDEWRQLGVQQSQGWIHYMIHEPEPHILLFRRPLPKH
ncbi:cyclin-dependent kinases regulatory subunit 2-like [Thunnus albacares]|uniref:cyclin-dependent kinases regulatory subunit 2-like n=1 Tax=Thunnus maccoyii TaxID=8240 RepID=UPI001C4ABAAC|nr:cyclin-dependent kinases regulatory subunit 2-like [Thunnus maccoyii]XP_044189956.1 cyclin-dependent kinases regulatory subunit 2-like [Thunnus albacares]